MAFMRYVAPWVLVACCLGGLVGLALAPADTFVNGRMRSDFECLMIRLVCACVLSGLAGVIAGVFVGLVYFCSGPDAKHGNAAGVAVQTQAESLPKPEARYTITGRKSAVVKDT